MHLTPISRMRQFAPIALVLLGASVAVAAYLQALDYPFIPDDAIYITDNHKLVGLHLTELWRLFTEPYNIAKEFLPLRELSYWFDLALFGMNPSAFRAHNILLYLLCLPLVYGATSGVWRYFRPADAAGAPWAAAVVTALFVLHPSHVEAVVWICSRKDVLSGMFSLLALWLAMCAKREKGLSTPYAAATLAALLAAILSKATAVAVAPVIALLWVIFWRDIPAPHRRYSMLLWPLASMLLAACLALVFAAIISTKIPFYFGVEAATRTMAVLGWLARLAISQESRHYFYPVLEDPYLPAMVVLGVAVLAAATVAVVMLTRKKSVEYFALAAFLLICIPSMQMIPYETPSLVTDHFLFLAVWPAMLLLVALSWRLKPVLRAILLLAVALPWGYQTVVHTRVLRSAEAMVEDDSRAYPGHFLAVYQKIWLQLHLGLFREASEAANSTTNPEFRDILARLVEADHAVNVGVASTGKPHEAMALLKHFELKLKQMPVQAKWNAPAYYVWKSCKSILATQWDYLAKQFPGDVSVRYNAGLWMLDVREYEYAAFHLRAATESQQLPESVRGAAFRSLGLALIGSGRFAKAEVPLRAALEQAQPDLRAYCLLAKVYQQTGRFEEAARAKSDCSSRAPGEGSVP